MGTSFQSIQGTFDILPDGSDQSGTAVAGSAQWQHVERTIRRVMRRFNLEEIRTPVLEPTELIARGVGQATDIVQKEMFAFTRSGTDYVLRPEVTAPVMRAYLQHHLDQRGGVQKLFYLGPCFRAEKPQKGRYRQFHQFGAEIIGTPDARADAETMAVMTAVYEAFGVTGTRLRINTLGRPEDRAAYRAALVEYLRPHAGALSEASRRRLETNPLRILDTKIDHEQKLLAEAPRLIEFVSDEARAHYDAVKGWLDDLEISYQEDPLLVRGLDYYTRTAFELESGDLGAQSALAGGGRYDLLAETLGSGRPVPAVGFAAGLERLFLVLAAQDCALPAPPAPDVFFASIGGEAERWVFRTAQQLRREGLHVALDLKGRSLKAQMREANRQKAQYTLNIGDNELSGGRATAKHMDSGEEEEVDFDELGKYLRRNLVVGSNPKYEYRHEPEATDEVNSKQAI